MRRIITLYLFLFTFIPFSLFFSSCSQNLKYIHYINHFASINPPQFIRCHSASFLGRCNTLPATHLLPLSPASPPAAAAPACYGRNQKGRRIHHSPSRPPRSILLSIHHHHHHPSTIHRFIRPPCAESRPITTTANIRSTSILQVHHHHHEPTTHRAREITRRHYPQTQTRSQTNDPFFGGSLPPTLPPLPSFLGLHSNSNKQNGRTARAV